MIHYVIMPMLVCLCYYYAPQSPPDLANYFEPVIVFEYFLATCIVYFTFLWR